MNKYRNKKVEVDGIKFDSKKEARRYSDLLLLQRAGEISELVLQPRFSIWVGGVHVCDYIADFTYKRGEDVLNNFVVEDVKGQKNGGAWRVFRLKQKLMKAVHGIDVVCV